MSEQNYLKSYLNSEKYQNWIKQQAVERKLKQNIDNRYFESARFNYIHSKIRETLDNNLSVYSDDYYDFMIDGISNEEYTYHCNILLKRLDNVGVPNADFPDTFVIYKNVEYHVVCGQGSYYYCKLKGE